MQTDDDKCGAKCRDGSPCQNYPVHGSERCRMHGGKGSGAPANNDNHSTHQLISQPGPYYERQSEDEQDRIDGWAESWARRGGYDGLGFDKMFQTHAIKLHQVESGDGYIAENGAVITRIVDRTESGEPIEKDEENPAFLYQARALKDVTRFLKEFGCLEDPDTQQAEATESVAAMLGGNS